LLDLEGVGPIQLDQVVEVQAAREFADLAGQLAFFDRGRRHLHGPGFAQVVDGAAAGVLGQHVAGPVDGAAGELAGLGLVVAAGDLVHRHAQVAHRGGGEAGDEGHREEGEDHRGAALAGGGVRAARRISGGR
jgi:hypothetical protein